MKKNILIIILAVIVLGLGAFIAYDKLFNKPSCPVCTKCDVKTEDGKLTLEKELSLADICTNTTGICEKEIVFKLGGKKHTIKTYIDMDDPYNDELAVKVAAENKDIEDVETANSITIDSKKIVIGGVRKLDKIAIIGDYLAIGTASGITPNAYKIDIYNSDFEIVDTYSSIYSSTDAMSETFSEYFKIGENSFTRYDCDTSKANSDGSNQILVEYLIKVDNGEFTETKLSETLEYCSAQNSN